MHRWENWKDVLLPKYLINQIAYFKNSIKHKRSYLKENLSDSVETINVTIAVALNQQIQGANSAALPNIFISTFNSNLNADIL